MSKDSKEYIGWYLFGMITVSFILIMSGYQQENQCEAKVLEYLGRDLQSIEAEYNQCKTKNCSLSVAVKHWGSKR